MVSLALGLTKRGHMVEFFLYYPRHDHFSHVLRERSIPIHSINKTSRFSIRPIMALWHLMKSVNYDAAVAFLPTPSVYAEIAHLVSRSVSLIVSERSVYMSESLSPTVWCLQQGHRFSDYITVNSEYQLNQMLRLFPWMRGKATTIRNGVDLSVFKPACHSDYDCPEPKFLVLASVVPNKNAVGLVHALAFYQKKYGHKCTIHWAGRVLLDAESQEEYREANRLLVRLGLQEQWQWLGERKDVHELLQQYDALIHPSFYEGFSNAICEAFACGCPVLASNVCDNTYLVHEGETGYLFNPSDHEDIARAMWQFSAMSPRERATMARYGRQIAETELSLDVYIGRYERLLQELVK